MTEPELRLWTCLRYDFEAKFRRQEPIGPYIVDFCCYSKRVIVEVDGIQHLENPADARRDAYLESLGFRIVRVWNGDVMTDLDFVLEDVAAALEEQPDFHHREA